MLKRFKVVALGVGAVLLLGVLGAGAAFAQTPPTTPTDYHTAVLARVATILGVDSAKLESAFAQARTETLDQAVKDGKITQAQADWMKQRMEQGGMGPGAGQCLGAGMGPGYGPGHMQGAGPMGGRFGGQRWATPTPAPAQ